MSELEQLPHPRPGIRLSYSDGVVLLVAAAAAVWLWPHSPQAAALVLTVVGHFFVFCNVVRVPTRLELTWAATFLINVSAWHLADAWTPTRMLAIQLPITAVIIVLTVRRADYHGIGWRRRHAKR